MQLTRLQHGPAPARDGEVWSSVVPRASPSVLCLSSQDHSPIVPASPGLSSAPDSCELRVVVVNERPSSLLMSPARPAPYTSRLALRAIDPVSVDGSRAVSHYGMIVLLILDEVWVDEGRI